MIPVEELFFFFIQTYNTALLYLLVTKPVLHVAYLHEIRSEKDQKKPWKTGLAGAVALALSVAWAGLTLLKGGEGTYMALIWIWAGPVLFGLWWAFALSHFMLGVELTVLQVPGLLASPLPPPPLHPAADCLSHTLSLGRRYACPPEGYVGH